MATPCNERAGKYALMVGKAAGLSTELAMKLYEAYLKSCEKWADGFKKGVEAYAVGKATIKSAEDLRTAYEAMK
jgi:hypothetical protein